MYHIYTDGAASPNPGRGGWGVVITNNHGKIIKTLNGKSEVKVSNNQMEITAAIKALDWLKPESYANIFSDSVYLVNSITKWIPKRGYKNYANAYLFAELLHLIDTKQLHIQWYWVKGHADSIHNELADRLATEAILADQCCPICDFELTLDTTDWSGDKLLCGYCGEWISYEFS